MKIVFSTGAGVSAESGISTFRDAGGLWEKYPVMQVASAQGFRENPELIHRFYNDRRKALLKAEPNEAHTLIAKLQDHHDVNVITQNVDDLHERAGSRNVLHLHGELMKIRSVRDPECIEALTPPDIFTSVETRGANGDPMRPHIVFFGEAVPEMDKAVELVSQADLFVVIGTSLNVYPAAGLVQCAASGTPIVYIDPNPASISLPNLTVIPRVATEGMRALYHQLVPANS